MSSLVVVEREQGVVWLTLNRPEAANSLSRALIADLERVIHELSQDREARVVVLTGAGDRVFCAGADLKERRGMSAQEVPVFLATARDLLDALAGMPCPTIAAINGAALGGGLELALACDLRVAVRSARMGLTETSLGIIPGAGGTQRLPRAIGVSWAKELIFTARKIDAEQALSLGLVQQVAAPGKLREGVAQLAREIAANAPVALRQAKRAIDGGMEKPLAQALSWEQECYAPTLQTEDRLEALRAFAEKRKPVFKGC